MLDIETSPVLSWVWGLWNQNVGLSQIHQDWHVLSFAAKWLNDPRVIYADQRHANPIENDKALLERAWALIDEADILITQNGKRFDVKKLNARFIVHGLGKPSSFRHIDLLQIAKKHFAFTSNKLEFTTDLLCLETRKEKSRKFVGFELWRECLKNNPEAWEEMEKYNRQDVLATEALYYKLLPWDESIDFSVYFDDNETHCKCGSVRIQCRGFEYTNQGKFQRYQCTSCGAWFKGSKNLLSTEKKNSFKSRVK